MINGNEYAFEDIQIVMDGNPVPLIGVTEIEYGSKRGHGNVYSTGKDPVSMTRGKKEYSLKMKVLQSLHEAIQRTIDKGGDVTDKKPFTVTVAYAPLDGVITVDQCLFVRINEFSKKMGSDDMNMEVEYSCTVGKNLYNV